MKANLAACFLIAIVMGGCSGKVPGHPEKVLAQYLEATQKGDFKAMYLLNVKTARQNKYLSQSEVGDIQQALKDNLIRNRAVYDSLRPGLDIGVRWAEKFYFPASSGIAIGLPYFMKPIGDDSVNAEYERASNIIVPVTATYLRQQEAPEFNKHKIKKARFDCILRKIREGFNVTIYSHDDKWYFALCVINTSSIVLFSAIDRK